MIKLRPTSWKIMLEVLVKASPTKVVEVPIQFDKRQAGESKFNSKQMIAYLKHLTLLTLHKHRKVINFLLIAGLIYAFVSGLVYFFTEALGWWYMLSVFIASAIGVLLRFFSEAKYVFGIARDPDAADYDWNGFYRGNPVQRWWKQSIAKTVWSWVPASSSLLDIGCGSSPIISHYPEAVGIDINEEKLAFIKDKYPSITVKAMSADLLMFGNGNFDYVLAIEVLEHLPKPEKAIAEIARVLKPGGRAVIATPDYRRKHWLLAEKFTPAGEQHISKFTRKSLEETCQKHGLIPLRHKYIAGCDLVELFAKSYSRNGRYPSSKLQLIGTGIEVIKRIAKPTISRANFAVTYKCNQQCKTCNIWQIYRDNPDRTKDEVTLWEFQKILENNNLMWLSLTGGEPFLRNDITELLESCSKKLKLTSIVTNGSKPELAERAVRNFLGNGDGLLTLNVSLEGQREVHDKFAGREGSYQRAMETLKRLSMIHSGRFRLGTEHLISQHTEGQTSHIEQVARELGIGITYTLDQAAHYYRNTGREIEASKLPKIPFSLSPLNLISKFFVSKAYKHRTVRCVAGEYSCFIDAYCTVYPCLFRTPTEPLKSLRETDYRIGKLSVKKPVKECEGCWTPCESYATMIFRPWRLL